LHGLQLLSLGTFQNGFLLLTLLFFYDIFFVFGTDVMLTVAISIDAPIKLLFPRDWYHEDGPKFALLGLGDIVLPGVFIALCLRYDIIMAAQAKLKKDADPETSLKAMYQAALTSSKTFFNGTMIGYFIAILTTVAVMMYFDHGQPALLYLVPACLSAVTFTAVRLGDFKAIWDFTEENFVNDDTVEDEKKDD
jgi:minor histocompatibility antigen H13